MYVFNYLDNQCFFNQTERLFSKQDITCYKLYLLVKKKGEDFKRPFSKWSFIKPNKKSNIVTFYNQHNWASPQFSAPTPDVIQQKYLQWHFHKLFHIYLNALWDLSKWISTVNINSGCVKMQNRLTGIAMGYCWGM